MKIRIVFAKRRGWIEPVCCTEEDDYYEGSQTKENKANNQLQLEGITCSTITIEVDDEAIEQKLRWKKGVVFNQG